MEQLSDAERTRSVLRPYGVWGVISPFNFPMALAAGPAGGALVAGNTVVLKPSPQGAFSAHKLAECLPDAGLPANAFHVLPGGDEPGRALVAHPGVDGLTFTGSYEVGMQIYKGFATRTPSRSSARWAARTPPSSRPRPTSPPRRGRRPVRLRLLRPEVLGLLAGVRASARCYDEFVAGLAQRAGELVGRRRRPRATPSSAR